MHGSMLGHKNLAEVGPDGMAWPEEFDRAVLFLIGEAASFVRDANLRVDASWMDV